MDAELVPAKTKFALIVSAPVMVSAADSVIVVPLFMVIDLHVEAISTVGHL